MLNDLPCMEWHSCPFGGTGASPDKFVCTRLIVPRQYTNWDEIACVQLLQFCTCCDFALYDSKHLCVSMPFVPFWFDST